MISIEPRYIYRFGYTGSDLIYIGKAAIGSAASASVWQIMKLAYSGSDVVSILWADGNSSFDNVWDDRATYSFS